eukprot:TRINITY_DN2226_c2_g1_i1.p1 TRINITY_DN2226_c2_g1~~TRINITY_DN2226_c2_g1_i1.p1  ORF type:complete len:176 (-),score=37.98 TRINITY_DN2226_c2_g1_i1:722-1249(-)
MGNYTSLQNDTAEPIWICIGSRQASQYLNSSSDLNHLMSVCQSAGLYTLSDIMDNYSPGSNRKGAFKNTFNSGYNSQSNFYQPTGQWDSFGSAPRRENNEDKIEFAVKKLQDALCYFCRVDPGRSYPLGGAHSDRVAHVIKNSGNHFEKDVRDLALEDGAGTYDRTLYASTVYLF